MPPSDDRNARDQEASPEDAQFVLDHLHDFVYRHDADGVFYYVSPAIERITGYTVDEWRRHYSTTLTDNPSNAAVVESTERAIQTGEAEPPYLVEIWHKNGERITLEVAERPIVEEGVVVGIVGVARDVSERHRVEVALRHTEAQSRALLRAMPDRIVQVDRQGRVEALSSELSAIEVEHPPLPKSLHAGVAAVAERAFRSDGVQVEELESGSEGTRRVLEARATIVDDETAMVMLRDITDRSRLEDERLRVEKLEALGLLAGGIAHDFNNLLTGILGGISLAGARITDDEVTRVLDQAAKATVRAAGLTQQLLTFARGGEPVRKVHRIDKMIREAIGFASQGAAAKAEVEIVHDLAPVEVDAGQLSQVLHNLALNAHQAMPQGGRLFVRGENVIHAPGTGTGEARFVRVTLRDTGVGISKADLERIFDPYFSKRAGGSGLGLASVYSIIRRHDGYINVESEVGVGTTFTIYLPASAKHPPGTKPDSRPPQGSARVLLMDDDELLCDLGTNALRGFGYRADSAPDGAEAIRRFREARDAGDPYAVVLLDLTIPGALGGVETLRELRRIDPDVRAIVCSGFSTDPVMSQYAAYGFVGVVTKPYHPDELGEAVARVVAGRPPEE